MSAFGNCIELLDDMDQFCDTVQNLGKVHKKIGINAGHLDVSRKKNFWEILLLFIVGI